MLTRMASVRLQTLGLRFLHFVVILAMVLPNGAIFTRTAQAASAEQIAETIPAPTETEAVEATPIPAIGAGEDITSTVILTPTETITITPTAILSPTLELATPTATLTVTETSLEPTETPTPTGTQTPTETITPTISLTPTATITPTTTTTPTQTVTVSDIFTVSQSSPVSLPISGGKVVGFGGAVTVTFPTQSEKLSVRMRTPAEESTPAFSLSGNPIEIIAQGQDSKNEITQFSKPLTITVSYDPESLWGDESGLSLFYYDPDIKDWKKIPSFVDLERHQIITLSDHLTVFDYSIETWQSAHLPSTEGFQVAQQTGAATYSMNLWTPPGPGGLQPELTLSYNSQVVDSALKDTQASWVGMGWSLDTGYIERNMYGTDHYLDDDTFSIVVGGISGMLLPDANDASLYHTANESFWKIKYYSETDTWKAWDKTGTVYEFNSQATYPYYELPLSGENCGRDGDRTWRWSLSKVTNIYNKYLTYTYATETKSVGVHCGTNNHNIGTVVTAVYPESIFYPDTRYAISFTRTSRTDFKNDWDESSTGMVLFERSLLSEVIILYNADGTGPYEQSLRRYVFTYDASHPIFPNFTWEEGGYTPALSQVTEYGVDNRSSLPPTTFYYNDGQHLTNIDNGYGGRVDFDYELWFDLDGDNSHTYKQSSPCSGPGSAGGWGMEGSSYRHCEDEEYLEFYGQVNHAIPDYYIRPGGGYIVQTEAIDYNGSSHQISSNVEYSSNLLTWSPELNLPTYITQSVDTVNIIPITISRTTSANFWLQSAGAKLYDWHVHLVPMRYRVSTKTVYSSSDDNTGVTTTYRYDEAAMNDTDHSNAANYTNSYIEKYQEFRGHAMVQEIGPAGSDDSQRVITTFFHQDDVKKGNSHTTLVTDQSFFDDFESLDSREWQHIGRSVTITRFMGDSALKLRVSSPRIRRPIVRRGYDTIQDTSGYPNSIFIQFRLNGANSQGLLYLSDGSTSFGIHATGTKIYYYNGNDADEIMSEFKKDCWYVLQIGLDGQQSLIQVWERDNPNKFWRERLSAYSGIWHFEAESIMDTLWLDNYSEGRLYNFSQDIYGSLGFSMGDAPETDDEDIYTGLGITWTYLITETMLDFGGDAEFLGTMTRSDYNESEQGSDQYGNLTRQVKSEWNGSNWVDYTLIRRYYYPNTANGKYLVGYPGWQNEHKCIGYYNGACSYNNPNPTAADLIGQTIYFYDGSHTLNNAPTVGILTYKKTLIYNYPTIDDHFYHDTKYEYDEWGNQTQAIEYSDAVTLTQFEVSGAQSTSIAYDEALHTFPIYSTNALDQTTRWTYSFTATAPISETNPNGAATTILADYDDFGRITQLIRPGDTVITPTMKMAYNDSEPFYTTAQQQISNGTYYTIRKFYNGVGELLQSQVVSTTGATTNDILVDYGYDAYGQVISQTVPYNASHVTGYHTPDTSQAKTISLYDILGRTMSVTPPGSPSQVYTYTTSSADQPTLIEVQTSDGDSSRMYRTFKDVWGRTKEVVPPLGPSVSYGYDYYDRLTIAQRGGVTTTLTYDIGGRKTQMVDPDMGTWNYTYDALGNLKNQTNALGCMTNLNYDALNRLSYKNSNSGECVGNTVNYYYDAGTYGIGYRTGMSDGSGSTAWTVDARGRTTQEIKNVTGSGSFKTLWSYNSANQVASMTYPDNNTAGTSEVVNYTYNSRMLNYSVTGTYDYLLSATYDAANRVDHQNLKGTFIIDYIYNNWGEEGGRLHNINSGTTDNPSLIQNLVYDYDDWGNISTISDYKAGNPQVQTFTYDNLNRLRSASASGGSDGIYPTEWYTYSISTGNLSGMGNQVSSKSYEYNESVSCPAGFRTIPHAVSVAGSNSYDYDCNGNQITRNVGSPYALVYDAENHLVEVSGNITATFTYDGDGNRVKSVLGRYGYTTIYIGNYFEWHSSNSAKKKYYYSGSQRIAQTPRASFFSDHLGSTSKKVSTIGPGILFSALYKPWGEIRYTNGIPSTTFKYTGQREEPFGLYYYGARWYDPALGRFVQPDSIVPGGVQGLDRYAYVNNNPVRYNDPTGHTYCDFGKCHKVEPPLKQAVSSLWDIDDYESVGNPKAAEKAFYHFLVDPGYFADLYTDPQAWTTSDEVANLDVFMQYSVFHMTADDLISSGFSVEVANTLSTAHMFIGMGDNEGSENLLAIAGVVSVEDLIAKANAKYTNLAGKWNWHHYEPKYLGGSVNGVQYRLPTAYHQFITNEFRRMYGYGQAQPSAEIRNFIMNEVYRIYPIPPGSMMR